MRNYPKTKVIRISEQQHKTLIKMRSWNVDVGNFICIAIKEKIERDYDYLLETKKINDDPFLASLDKAIRLQKTPPNLMGNVIKKHSITK